MLFQYRRNTHGPQSLLSGFALSGFALSGFALDSRLFP